MRNLPTVSFRTNAQAIQASLSISSDSNISFNEGEVKATRLGIPSRRAVGRSGKGGKPC